MLELLVKYAIDHDLVREPGFAPKEVRWVVQVDEHGNFLEVVPLEEEAEGKRRGRSFPKCPERGSEMQAGGQSHFLIDRAEVVTLLGAKDQSFEAETKLRVKHEFFIKLLRDAGRVMPELQAAAHCLSDEGRLGQMRKRLKEQKASPQDNVTFRIADMFSVESEKWHEWWRQTRKSLSGFTTGRRRAGRKNGQRLELQMRCFATGDLVPPQMTHPKIKGLDDVGGIRRGDVLVAFDKNAFESYRLSRSTNAAVSEDAASAYTAALYDLIKETGQRLAGAKVVHWFKNRVPSEDNPLSWLLEGSDLVELHAQARAKELLESIRTGRRADLLDNRFYALTLSGARGRVMVRDWMEGQFEVLAQNVIAWFDDLAIVDYAGRSLAGTPGIERIITSLLPPRPSGQKYQDWVRPIAWARLPLWHAAMRCDPIPYSLLTRLVLINTNFHVTATLENALAGKSSQGLGATASLLHRRMGLMKVYHLRKNLRKRGNGMTNNLGAYLNEEHPHPAYQCGRLMAVLAALQRSALGDVGAGVVQRYYAAASSTPALVLGRLTRTSQFHLNKLEGGLAYWYETKIGRIWARIRDSVPRTLNLEEQSLFALGYYQQMADLRIKKSNSGQETGGEQ